MPFPPGVPVPRPEDRAYRLRREGGAQVLVMPDGGRVPLGPALGGRVEARSDGPADLELAGFAFDPKAGEPATRVVVFAGEASIYAGRASRTRPELQQAFGLAAPPRIGFRYRIPRSWIGTATPALDVVALFPGPRAARLADPPR